MAPSRFVRRGAATVLSLLLSASVAGSEEGAADVLPSWNDGPAKKALVDFVRKVTTPGGPDFVPEAERIAVFDNDGTLWAEQPVYFQLAFAMDRVRALAPSHPEWKDNEPFRSVLAGDTKAALAGGKHAASELVMASHAGMTTQEFEAIVREWIASAKHPTLERPYVRCTYRPMVELLAHLRANGFRTYIVSGGGVDFMRPWVEKAYGIPPEQVVGSRIRVRYEAREGGGVLVRLPEIDHVDDGPGKPVGIHQVIGRRPILAFGNSDGDFEMLEWTTSAPGPRLGLLLRHTDAAREWAYDRDAHVGRLSRALDAAPSRGWVVVDMKQEWRTVFP
jgi:phosphoglycolate phosphatase-like HAD superfamily hydrolase